MTTQGIEKAVQKGMAFLYSAQQADGGFASFSSPTMSPFKPVHTYQTTFTPALILSALNTIDGSPAKKVKKKLAAWLLAQRGTAWSFNYWALAAPERKKLPYPDDLDDTFCALVALRQYDPTLVDESCLGNVVKLLVAAETQVGGPYKTWLVPKTTPKTWQDVDLAVNSNIAYFLGLVAEPLPNLTALQEQAILAGSFMSPYYPSPYPLIYYIARTYTGEHADKLIDYLVTHEASGWGESPLSTALAISALTQLDRGDLCNKAIRRLLTNQRVDGSWAAEAFCLDPALHNKKFYSGCPALTTALSLEALARYEKSTRSVPEKRVMPRNTKTDDKLYEHVNQQATAELYTLKPNLRKQSMSILDRIYNQDKSREILLLPYFFNKSLLSPAAPKSADSFVELGLANLYGWMAYTIYDDFLDNEGVPKLLSAANVALRRSVKHFDQALSNPAFQQLVTQTFDEIDEANTTELVSYRMDVTNKAIVVSDVPSYANVLDLANRSMGHTLTPLGVLAAAGVALDDPRALLVRRALQHYLVARQLSDDLHDWEQDVRAGIITYVVATILRELSVTSGSHAFTKLVPRMQQQFWHNTLVSVCEIITEQTALARSTALSSGLLKQSNIIATLVDDIDATVTKTLTEQSKAEKFLAAYRG